MSDTTILVIEDDAAIRRGVVDALLSERETGLLRYLLDAAGRVVSRDEILRHVWGLDPARTETRTLDMHIMHLRTKLRDRDQEMLVTVRGKGWRFHAEETS